ncbi:enolase C-terminal domain-like protein [Streptomyces sp. NPDC050204]|uniref:enolase C-terminal domain-like protein n=1 Tax=Streptomyces sp. NPDC050204 TaxID=3155514 RepID=UPI003445A21E
MAAPEAVIDAVRVVWLADAGHGPFQEGDSTFAVLVEAAGTTGTYGPVDELPAALIAAGLGTSAVGRRVCDHEEILAAVLARLGQHGAGLGRWAAGALDCAVWDLHGRLAGLPVAALLTGDPAGRVPLYGSWLSLDLADSRAGEAVRRTAAEGYAFTKWAVRRGNSSPEQMAELAGRAASWAGAPVALDALGTWGLPAAGETGRLLPDGAVRWVEDPLPRTEPAAYRELLTRSGLPAAFGERIDDTQQAQELLEVGPAAFTFDVVWCGGITQALAWMDLAARAGVPVHLHGRAFLPALHVAAAFPEVAQAVEYQVVWEPRRQQVLTATVLPEQGQARLSDWPGLGPEVRC